MTRWETFRLLTECLRPAVGGGRPTIPGPPVPWERVVEASSDHLVAPALGWSLRGDERVPKEVFGCFDALLELNRQRNVLMLESLEHVVESLNRAGVAPVLLKGTATLVDELFPDPGMRVLGDIDLLLPEAALADGAAALHAAGFVLQNQRVRLDSETHHLPARVHPTSAVSVELHSAPVPPSFQALVDSAGFFERARPIRWRGVDARMPSPIDRIAHNVVHGQIIDEHYWRGIPRLRQLLELAAMRTRYASNLATADLERRFAAAGFGHVLADTLTLSEELLERPGSRAHSAALRRLEATVNQPTRQRWTIYHRTAVRNAKRVLRNPRLLLHTFSPRFWRSEFDGLVRRLTMSRW